MIKLKTWFTADTHFGHENIIKHCNRPFKTVDHMDRTLIQLWNSRVKKHDLVIHLGDFMFRGLRKREYYLDQLNGHITFLKGNHDHNNSLNTKITSLVVHISNLDIYCTHKPEDYSSSYTINLVGHVHNAWKVKKIYNTYLVNVGVDVWDYHPVDINEILKAIKEYDQKSNV
ncbi:MAG: metallophosphoesterase [Thaumarchaeota archaeon]|nr:MAG: metallophosphoesterase [Nitrososphaerota archaeon]